MIVKDESAPLDEDRPCVSVTVFGNGEEASYRGSSYLVAVLDDDGICYCGVGGELGPDDLAMLNLSTDRISEEFAQKSGFAVDYHFESIRVLLDEMQGRFRGHEAD
ncbi:hypothetical protein VJ923_06020 [Adlercreutzia sp. R25]|uniref:Uncharacterized protein n=1 Tax=Adlercreutzia shanghongiae TaxID=3111773 RepID=A0ABU6IX19_9ACTN|nr:MULTISPECIES: hypothetical protein [unclassified Adlercreutzia]MEC4272708.1 hypothetical protein [Adlercreutzia sp. R25]MEC4294392.1 hypothetical protein [Adlercreutzia sp. R22]